MDFRTSVGRSGPWGWVPLRWGMFALLLVALLVFFLRQEELKRRQVGPPPGIDTRLAAVQRHPGREEAVRIGVAGASPPADPQEPAPEGFFPGVKPQLLEQVRDNTVFRAAEHEAFFHLLQLAAQSPHEQLQSHARSVSFVQMFNQPGQYRGQVVLLRGRVRQVQWQKAPENQYDIPGWHQVVLQLDEHPSDPVIAFVLELPSGFPAGPEVDETVELVGFFYKRWAYLARDTVRTAPLVLARSFRWQPRPRSQPTSAWWQVLLVAAAAGGVLAALAVWVMWRTLPPGYRPRPTPSAQEQLQIGRHLEQLQSSLAAETPGDDSDQTDSQ